MTQTPPPDGRVAKWILLLTLLLALAARLAAGGQAAAEKPVAELYKQAKLASVEVLVDDHLAGSGFFADKQGLVLTAAHVIGRPGRRLEILSPAAGRLEAKLLAVDLGQDLALLRVNPREGGYPALAVNGELPPPGEDVFLLGSLLFRHAVLLRGTVARDQTVFEYHTGKYVKCLHVASTVAGGMSGGPWLNRRGEVVGLQSGVISLNSLPVGLANVIPGSAIRGLLKSRRTAATPTIGAAVEETWQHQREVLDRFPPRTEALLLRGLKKDGPAARAGLKQWDAVVAADGQKVRLSGELLRIIRSKQPGKTLKLTVLGPDGTGTREVTVRLGKLEAGWPESSGEK